MTQMTLTQAELKRQVSYDEKTGLFRRLRDTSRQRAGDACGNAKNGGYIRFRVNGHEYFAHRLAWLYVHGEWPANHIDHIDRNPSNNAIGNLRLATCAENNQNKVSAQSNSESGVLGVSLHKKTGMWRARICLNRVSKTLGYFATVAEARDCYLEAKKRLHSFAVL